MLLDGCLYLGKAKVINKAKRLQLQSQHHKCLKIDNNELITKKRSEKDCAITILGNRKFRGKNT